MTYKSSSKGGAEVSNTWVLERGKREVVLNGQPIGEVTQLHPSKRWSYRMVGTQQWAGNYNTKDDAALKLITTAKSIHVLLNKAFEVLDEKQR